MLKAILKYVSVPLILLVTFLVYVAIYYILGLPSPSEIVDFAKESYADHAYLIVFLGALGEGLLMFNLYYPGSVMVVLGVTLSSGFPLKAALLVALTILAFFITAVINYWLGKYGWYHILVRVGFKQALEKAKLRVEKKGVIAIFVTYIHPNLGALTSTSCGILKMSFIRFLTFSFIALIFWNSLWGIVTYNFGPAVLQLASFSVFISLLVLWIIIAVIRAVILHRSKSHSTKVDTTE